MNKFCPFYPQNLPRIQLLLITPTLLASATITLPGSCFPASAATSHDATYSPSGQAIASTELLPPPTWPQFPLTLDAPSTSSKEPCDQVDFTWRACLPFLSGVFFLRSTGLVSAHGRPSLATCQQSTRHTPSLFLLLTLFPPRH